jgi:threonyl-tRNA synthetase
VVRVHSCLPVLSREFSTEIFKVESGQISVAIGKNELLFPRGTLVSEIVNAHYPKLKKIAVAALCDSEIVDLSTPIQADIGSFEVITHKDEAALDVIRHSCAHLMAHAVKRLKPEVQVTIGPVIENGFYYDFSVKDGFSEEDLLLIADEMKAIVKADYAIVREQWQRDQAIEYFRDLGEHYKVEIIKDLPDEVPITIYKQDDFIDLCRGPHVPRTGFLKAFQLTKLAGAYWRGDAKNEMLQRVYGTAWCNIQQLQAYLKRLREAQERDHRLLSKKMDLFHIQENAPGMVFWHPNGWSIYRIITDYMSARLRQFGYEEVCTPLMADSDLWQRSGHADKFSEMMFFTETEKQKYALKPMNCPLHIQIFNHGLRSYRDLPLRLAEFGCCHRNEPSGSLHGLMRVREFTQDDAHIFCTKSQVTQEVSLFINQLYEIYKDFGFDEVQVKLSTRPDQRVGSDEVWDEAEKALEDALQKNSISWEHLPGEGAFYGPKIEFSLRDSLGRVWQCGTIQLDFFMPQRLGAEYIDEHGDKQTPVMLHRATLGSFERFIAILLEHYGGNLPLWLAPTQVMVMNITDEQAPYVTKITEILKKNGIRANKDLRNEKIGFKIRTHTIARVPVLVVVGSNEVACEKVSVRLQSGKDLGQMSVDDLLMLLQEDTDKTTTGE